jgi:hypothetical protein
MGECDRFKPFISDYLEKSLDPTTHQKFEKALENSDELQLLTSRVRLLKTHLEKLDRVSCSDDFSLRLRERIHTVPQPFFKRQNVMRMSMAFSLVIVLAVALVSMMNLSDSPETSIPLQGTPNLKIDEANPVSSPASTTNPGIFKTDSPLDVKTKNNQQTAADSTKINPLPNRRTEERFFKRVDQKKE